MRISQAIAAGLGLTSHAAARDDEFYLIIKDVDGGETRLDFAPGMYFYKFSKSSYPHQHRFRTTTPCC